MKCGAGGLADVAKVRLVLRCESASQEMEITFGFEYPEAALLVALWSRARNV